MLGGIDRAIVFQPRWIMLESASGSVKKGRILPPAATAPALHIPEWLGCFLQYKSYILLFLAAALCTAIGTPLYILMARRLGWVDHPGGRKDHARATPTMGGLVVFLSVYCGAIIALQLDNRVGEMLRGRSYYIYGLLACTACMILLGIIDDRHAIRPQVKLLVQSVVAVAAVSLDFRVKAITLPFMESMVLPVPLSVVVSLLWIIGITNAINLTDGLDGLAAGISFMAAGVNAVVAIWLGNYYMAVMMILLAGALLGFLRWNFHPARVFLGDTGSLGLGMYLALASLQSAQKSHTAVMILVPLFALGYPIFDTLLAVAPVRLRPRSHPPPPGQPRRGGERRGHPDLSGVNAGVPAVHRGDDLEPLHRRHGRPRRAPRRRLQRPSARLPGMGRLDGPLDRTRRDQGAASGGAARPIADGTGDDAAGRG